MMSKTHTNIYTTMYWYGSQKLKILSFGNILHTHSLFSSYTSNHLCCNLIYLCAYSNITDYVALACLSTMPNISVVQLFYLHHHVLPDLAKKQRIDKHADSFLSELFCLLLQICNGSQTLLFELCMELFVPCPGTVAFADHFQLSDLVGSLLDGVHLIIQEFRLDEIAHLNIVTCTRHRVQGH